MGLKCFDTLERDLVFPFPTCPHTTTTHITHLTFLTQIRGFIESISALLDKMARKLRAIAEVTGTLMELSKWQDYNKQSRKCELCVIHEEIPLLGSHTPGIDIDDCLLFARLASSELCKEHSPEFDIIARVVWDKSHHDFAAMLARLDLHRRFPPALSMAPYYIPDNLLEAGFKDLLLHSYTDLSTESFQELCGRLLERNDLLGRTLLHQFLDLNGQNCEADLLHIIEKGHRRSFSYDTVDCLGRSPLHIACLKGYGLLAHELLKKGANPRLKTNSGFCALHFAAAKGFFDICQILNNTLELRGPDGRNAKDYALAKNHFNVAKFLATTRRDGFKKTIISSYPLIRAIMFGSATQVRNALTAGADPNVFVDDAFSGGGRTESALTIALDPRWGTITPNGLSFADILLEFGATLEARSDRGETALHICTRKYSIGSTHWLLSYGADVLARDQNGYTALMLAAKKGSCGICSTILSHARDRSILFEVLHATDNNGHTALDHARWHSKTYITKRLEGEAMRLDDSSMLLSQSNV